MFQGRRTLMEQTGGSSAETAARYSGVLDVFLVGITPSLGKAPYPSHANQVPTD